MMVISQCQNESVNYNNVEYFGLDSVGESHYNINAYCISGRVVRLGIFKTRERALEVRAEIEQCHLDEAYMEDYYSAEGTRVPYLHRTNKVYTVPEK